MKKYLIRIAVVLIILLGLFYLVVVPKVVAMVTDYDRYTFESVFDDPERLEIFQIGDAKDPSSYGFDNYEELDYTTLFDGLALNGWYIPSSNDSVTQTLLICHGRTSNRLKTMKYLEIIKDYGLDSIYNVFIPDLRNSGKSDEAKTGMGYEFAEDIGASLKMLNSKFGSNNFTVWGFSMGAMATATMINRADIMNELATSNIQVDRLILTSPLSNVEKTVGEASANMGIPGFIFDITFKRFSKQSDGFIYEMKYSYLLKDTSRPVLVMYGTNDNQTPHEILEEELQGLNHVQAERYEGAEHVRLYTHPDYKERYAADINAFLRK